MKQKPDILMIVLDTQRADRLAAYGFGREISPNLDALAAESVQFHRAIAPAQWTVPSHASLFTGCYPWAHGMSQMDSVLAPHLPTLAARLKAIGYHTVGFSNNPLVGVIPNGLERDFNVFHNYGGLLTMRPQSASHGSNHFSVRHSFGYLQPLLRRIQGYVARAPEPVRFLFSPPFFALWQRILRLRGAAKGDSARSLDDAAQLLIQRPGQVAERPIFGFINLMGVHTPYAPPQWAINRFVPQALCAQASGPALWRFNVILHQLLGPLSEPLTAEVAALCNGLYNAEVAAQDQLLGAFLQRLHRAGALDRLLLIVLADHGEQLGEQNLLGHGFAAYESLLHVPLLIRPPGAPLHHQPGVSDFVSTRRLFHTILTVAGAASPAEERLSLLQTEPAASEQGIVLAEARPPHTAIELIEARHPGLLAKARLDRVHHAIYQQEHKLIIMGEEQLLYAIPHDRHETTDLHKVKPMLVKSLLQSFHRELHSPVSSYVRTNVGASDLTLQQRLKSLGYG
ncbi:MAG: sulfatase [Caldilineaceae bacterium]